MIVDSMNHAGNYKTDYWKECESCRQNKVQLSFITNADVRVAVLLRGTRDDGYAECLKRTPVIETIKYEKLCFLCFRDRYGSELAVQFGLEGVDERFDPDMDA